MCIVVDSPLVYADFLFFSYLFLSFLFFPCLKLSFPCLFYYMKRFRCPDLASQSLTVGVSVFHEFASRIGWALINWLSGPGADSQLWSSVPDEAALSIVMAFGRFIFHVLLVLSMNSMATNFLICDLIRGLYSFSI